MFSGVQLVFCNSDGMSEIMSECKSILIAYVYCVPNARYLGKRKGFPSILGIPRSPSHWIPGVRVDPRLDSGQVLKHPCSKISRSTDFTDKLSIRKKKIQRSIQKAVCTNQLGRSII